MDVAQAMVQVRDLTWIEYRRRIAERPIVLLPIGALEQHGQHLPLDTDTRITTVLARRLAERLQALVLPPIEYGARSLARSGGGSGFPGTVDLDGGTLINLVRDVLREQARHGATRLVVLLGHGENDPFAIEGAALARRDRHGDEELQIVIIGWWQVLNDADVAPLFPEGFPGWDLEHAARIETSLMLALAPDAVRRDRIAAIDSVVPTPFTVLPTPVASVPTQGSLADPRGATAEVGQALADVIVDRLADALCGCFELGDSVRRQMENSPS